MLSLLAIVLLRNPEEFGPDAVHTSKQYGTAARSMVLTRLANGNVTVKTLQALCLLSFYNHLSKSVLEIYDTSDDSSKPSSCRETLPWDGQKHAREFGVCS